MKELPSELSANFQSWLFEDKKCCLHEVNY